MSAANFAFPLVPPGSVEVVFSKFMPRYVVGFVAAKFVCGSREGMNYALFRANKTTRPKRRGLRNPTRSARRTDFGWLIEEWARRNAAGIFLASKPVHTGELVALRRDGTVEPATVKAGQS